MGSSPRPHLRPSGGPRGTGDPTIPQGGAGRGWGDMGALSHTREGPELRVWPQRVPRLRGGRGVGLCRTGDEGSERAAGRGWPDTPDGLPQPGAVQFPGLRRGPGGSAGGGVVASRAWTGCRRPGEWAWPAARHAPGPWRAPSPSRRGERDGPLPTARKSGGGPSASRSALFVVACNLFWKKCGLESQTRPQIPALPPAEAVWPWEPSWLLKGRRVKDRAVSACGACSA